MYPKLQIIPILNPYRRYFRNHLGKIRESATSKCWKKPAYILDSLIIKSTTPEDLAWISRRSWLRKTSKCDMDLILIGSQLAQEISRRVRKGTAVAHRNNSSMSCHIPQSLPKRSVDKAKPRWRASSSNRAATRLLKKRTFWGFQRTKTVNFLLARSSHLTIRWWSLNSNNRL